MTALAALLGYVIGSVPTAGWLGRLWGIDLRQEGSGNPGTKNALSTGGPVLAGLVLVVEAAKGFAAVQNGYLLADETAAVAAGLGAAAGNVYNIWYRFQGGKGLGISLGILLGLWPMVVLPVVGIIVLGVLATRSAGLASLGAMVGLVMLSVVWVSQDWPTGGLGGGSQLVLLSLGLTVLLAYKHWRDSPLNSHWTARTREPA